MRRSQPLMVNEMGFRVLMQCLVYGGLSAFLLWHTRHFWDWVLNGFPSYYYVSELRFIWHGFLAVFAVSLGLRAAGQFLFELTPFLLAKAFRPKPPKLTRR